MKRAAAFAALSVLLALACRAAEEKPTLTPIAPVVVETVKVMSLEDQIEATGQLTAPERAEIAAEVAGRITEILVAEGASVEAGTVVLEIDRERRRLELDSARAGLAEARASAAEQQRDFARIEKLYQQDVASESRLDQARTALAAARSRLDGARANTGVAERAWRDASVRAPFSGYVARRRVSRGEFVREGQALFELVALDPIEVELHLPEADSGRIRIGQGVEIRVAPYPDERFRGELSYVSPVIDEASRTLRVKARLGNSDRRLRPGLFARADLGVSRREDVPMVLEEAVLQRADGSVVFRLVEGDRVERRRIETGVYRDGYVEVVRGVGPEDRIVVRGQARLADGEMVAVQAPDGGDEVPVVSTAPGVEAGP